MIGAQGSSTIADDCLTLFAGQLPFAEMGYFMTSQTKDFVPNPGGREGFLCLGGQISRFPDQTQNTSLLGWIAIDLDLSDVPLHGAVQPGETWNFQAWFRDKTPTTPSNFTGGLSITFQ